MELLAVREVGPELYNMVPFIFAGLSVAFAFKEACSTLGRGTTFIGSICAAYVGFAFEGLPMAVHLPLTLLSGALGGALWAVSPVF